MSVVVVEVALKAGVDLDDGELVGRTGSRSRCGRAVGTLAAAVELAAGVGRPRGGAPLVDLVESVLAIKGDRVVGQVDAKVAVALRGRGLMADRPTALFNVAAPPPHRVIAASNPRRASSSSLLRSSFDSSTVLVAIAGLLALAFRKKPRVGGPRRLTNTLPPSSERPDRPATEGHRPTICRTPTVSRPLTVLTQNEDEFRNTDAAWACSPAGA